MQKTVLVVDDHPLFRKALVNLVQETGVCSDVAAAASAEEGLQRLQQRDVDLILLDLGLPGAAGVDALSLLRGACSAVIVVVSATEQRQEVAAVQRAGASAVVSKSVSMDALKEVVMQALAGTLPEQKWIRPAGSLTFAEKVGRGLTVRQQEIATMLMEGHSNKEIGLRLGLAEITVKTHLTAIFRQLGVVNRTQAVIALRRLGIDYGSTDRSASQGVGT
ncbi:MAG TPA: response regulator transcription factor [Ramlibacter sp.]|jgi:DNA-binding NarL/FixJ family response regulator|nr:response regulator transcription factor [Ramlibacter sp.]